MITNEIKLLTASRINEDNIGKDYFTIKQVSKRTGLSKSTIYKLREKGVHFINFNGINYISCTDVEILEKNIIIKKEINNMFLDNLETLNLLGDIVHEIKSNTFSIMKFVEPKDIETNNNDTMLPSQNTNAEKELCELRDENIKLKEAVENLKRYREISIRLQNNLDEVNYSLETKYKKDIERLESEKSSLKKKVEYLEKDRENFFKTPMESRVRRHKKEKKNIFPNIFKK